MRAVVAQAPGELVVTDVELDEPRAGEVRLDVLAAGLCHTDLSFVSGVMPAEFPFVPGHEVAGTVSALGPDVDGLEVGQRVIVDMSRPCRQCVRCVAGEPWLCEGARNTAARGRLADGSTLNGLMEIGGFAEQAVVRANAVIPVSTEVPVDVAALLGCGVTTGIGAVRNVAQVAEGDTAVVLGLGGVGLAAVVGARLAGAGQIIAVDLSADKEALARQLGATDFVLSSATTAKEVRALTAGQGADHVLECVGRAATARLAWQCTRRGGRTTIVGVGPKDDVLSFNMLELYHFARELRPAPMGCSDFQVLVPELAGLVLDGSLDLGPLITRRLGLDEVPAAMQQLGAGGRQVVLLEPAG